MAGDHGTRPHYSTSGQYQAKNLLFLTVDSNISGALTDQQRMNFRRFSI
jgi:hypothetical protein